jgi:hypothetical protein
MPITGYGVAEWIVGAAFEKWANRPAARERTARMEAHAELERA